MNKPNGLANGHANGHVVIEQKTSIINDPAYQSNMRNLLQRPISVTLNGSRPNSAKFLNLDSRPSSARISQSRSSSASSSRKSSSLNGPYLTESIRTRHIQRS